MGVNLRELAESDLSVTLEGEYGLPINIIYQDGSKQLDIEAQVLYSSVSTDPATLAPIIVEEPVVTVRRSSLDQIPVAGQTVYFQVPNEPRRDADKDDYIMSTTRAPEKNRSIGFIRYYLQRANQS
jgi:hypothetical protein